MDTESVARYQLPFTVGDVIQILEANEGWYKGILLETGERGVFPASFFRIKPSEEVKDPVMRELHNVFREWNELLKNYYLVLGVGGSSLPLSISYIERTGAKD